MRAVGELACRLALWVAAPGSRQWAGAGGGGSSGSSSSSGSGSSARKRRGAAAASAQALKPSALRCIVCTLLPCLSLVVALLALFFLAPLALRLGLLKQHSGAPGEAALAGLGSELGLSSSSSSGEWGGSCVLPAHSSGAAAKEEPCVFVLIDAATCSGAKRLVGKILGWALRLRDVLLPRGLR